jgi:opacity protein-like surface antigen
MRFALPILCLVCIFSLSAKAQSTIAPPQNTSVFFNLNFDMGIPMHEFKTYNDEIAVGGGFSLFFQPSNKIPVLVGFDLAIMGNGHKIQNETLTADIVAGTTVIETLYFPMRVETYNNITKGNLHLRVQSPTKFFKPYVDGMVGFNHFSTNTSIYDESEEYYLSEEDNPLITSSQQNSSWALSYGGAAGLMVQLKENVFIDVRCAYTLGTEAEYYVEDDIENWEITFNTIPTSQTDVSDEDIDISAVKKQSTTDMVLGTVGVTFKF